MSSKKDKRTTEELATAAKYGDTAAMEELWHRVKGLAAATAARWIRKLDGYCGTFDFNESLKDGTQAGAIAMLSAVKVYDPTKGAKFTTVYYQYIQTELQKCFYLRTEKQRKDPLQLMETTSLDAPLTDEASEEFSTLGETIPDTYDFTEDVLQDDESRRISQELDAAIRRLRPEWQDLIQSVYFGNMSQSDYANAHSKSRQAVSRTMDSCMNRLKNDPQLNAALYDLNFNFYGKSSKGMTIQEKYLLGKE